MLDSWIGSIEIRAAAFQQDEDRFRQVLEGELDHLRDQALDEYEQCGLFSAVYICVACWAQAPTSGVCTGSPGRPHNEAPMVIARSSGVTRS